MEEKEEEEERNLVQTDDVESAGQDDVLGAEAEDFSALQATLGVGGAGRESGRQQRRHSERDDVQRLEHDLVHRRAVDDPNVERVDRAAEADEQEQCANQTQIFEEAIMDRLPFSQPRPHRQSLAFHFHLT